MTQREYNMPTGKKQMLETFSKKRSGHSVRSDTRKYSCQELHHKEKYAQEQYLASQSHDIEYTITAPKLSEVITNSYINTLVTTND